MTILPRTHVDILQAVTLSRRRKSIGVGKAHSETTVATTAALLHSLAEVCSCKLGVGAQLLLNSEQLVVFRKTLRPARSASLDLACSKSNDKVCDEAVLSLTRPVRDHGAPALLLGHVVRLDGLGHCADLVHLQQEAIARLLLDGSGNSVGVGHQEVVTHNLDRSGGGELGITLPVVLVKGILDGEDGVVLDEPLVHLSQLVAGDPVLGLALGVLEVQVVLAVLAELARRNVHSNEDLAFIPRNLDGFHEELQGLPVVLEVGSKATLVTDGCSVQPVLLVDQLLQVVVQLATHPHRFGEAGCASREDHELLHSELVASVAASVDDVEAGHRHEDVLHPSKVGDVTVERNSLVRCPGLAHGHADAKDGIGAQLVLVVGAIQGQHQLVNLLLLNGVHALRHNLWGYQVVNVVHRLLDSLAMPSLGLVPHLQGLIDASRSSRWDSSSEDSLLCGEVDLDGWVAPRVVDLARVDLLDGHPAGETSDLL